MEKTEGTLLSEEKLAQLQAKYDKIQCSPQDCKYCEHNENCQLKSHLNKLENVHKRIFMAHICPQCGRMFVGSNNTSATDSPSRSDLCPSCHKRKVK